MTGVMTFVKYYWPTHRSLFLDHGLEPAIRQPTRNAEPLRGRVGRIQFMPEGEAVQKDLLSASEPPAAAIERPNAASPFFFTCDHASARIPEKLGRLGLTDNDLGRHIAWDIGAASVAGMLSAYFDATLVLQNYSRLVIDCNRPVEAPSSIPTISEDTVIPGNEAPDPAEVAARRQEIFTPYHEIIASELDWRQKAGQQTVLVSVHSFTPHYQGEERPWDLGILFNRDRRLGDNLITLIDEDNDIAIGENQPYSVDDETDYTIPVHGEMRGHLHVMIEMRQDHIAAPEGQRLWFERLARALGRVQEGL